MLAYVSIKTRCASAFASASAFRVLLFYSLLLSRFCFSSACSRFYLRFSSACLNFYLLLRSNMRVSPCCCASHRHVVRRLIAMLLCVSHRHVVRRVIAVLLFWLCAGPFALVMHIAVLLLWLCAGLCPCNAHRRVVALLLGALSPCCCSGSVQGPLPL